MKAIRVLALVLAVYIGVVVAFECFVAFMGKRQADSGVRPDESWIVITTTDAHGSTDTVVAGVESGGGLYVSANHWPRGWYNRALQNPEVAVTRTGTKRAYRAMPISDDERTRVAQDYNLPWAIRLLTGFPPRSYLRLDAP